MSVWPQGRDEQKYGHSRKQEGTAFKIIILVLKKEVHDRDRHIEKPQQIRNDKYFAERDTVIQRNMDKFIMLYRSLQMTKPYQINWHIDHQRNNVFIFMI